jgi:hypothetical protein
MNSLYSDIYPKMKGSQIQLRQTNPIRKMELLTQLYSSVQILVMVGLLLREKLANILCRKIRNTSASALGRTVVRSRRRLQEFSEFGGKG